MSTTIKNFTPITRENLRIQYIEELKIKAQKRREAIMKEIDELYYQIQVQNREGKTKYEKSYSTYSHQDNEWVSDLVTVLKTIFVDSDITKANVHRINIDWTPIENLESSS